MATDLLQFAQSVGLVDAQMRDYRGWWEGSNWPCCNWTGITCSRRDDNRQPEFTALALSDASLTGEVVYVVLTAEHWRASAATDCIRKQPEVEQQLPCESLCVVLA